MNKKTYEENLKVTRDHIEDQDNIIRRKNRRINKLEGWCVLIFILTYLGSIILFGTVQGVTSEVQDHITYPAVLNNVGSYICNERGQRFIDWEDNILECGTDKIDFNKPFYDFKR